MVHHGIEVLRRLDTISPSGWGTDAPSFLTFGREQEEYVISGEKHGLAATNLFPMLNDGIEKVELNIEYSMKR